VIGQRSKRNLHLAHLFLAGRGEFSQTLGKQTFLEARFELSENLWLILLDYAQKRRDTANITFSAAC